VGKRFEPYIEVRERRSLASY